MFHRCSNVLNVINHQIAKSAQMSTGNIVLRKQTYTGRQLDRTVEAGDRRPGENPAETGSGHDESTDPREYKSVDGRWELEARSPGQT